MTTRSPVRGSRPMAAAAGALTLLLSGGCATRPDEEIPSEGDPTEAMIVLQPDLRKATKAERTPPPIQGGTLLAVSDGDHVVVGDPDRHRIVGASLADGSLTFELDLQEGSLPGRSVEDDAGQVHVVLRGSGELLTLDPSDGEVIRRNQVCAEPRGLAYEPEANVLHLACADGYLWTYSADTGQALGEVFVARDLRDVALADAGSLWVSTFRSARLFRVDAAGEVSVVPQLPGLIQVNFTGDLNNFDPQHFTAEAAWRLVSDEAGNALVIHQRAKDGVIQIPEHAKSVPDEHVAEPVRIPLDPEEETEQAAVDSSYGGSGPFGVGGVPSCEAIVHSALTSVAIGGDARGSSALPNAVLPVDLAVSPSGWTAIASAGMADEGAPKPMLEPPGSQAGDQPTGIGACFDCGPLGSVTLVRPSDVLGAGSALGDFGFLDAVDTPLPELSDLDVLGGGCAPVEVHLPIPEPASSVAFVPGTQLLVVQVRQPSRIYIVDYLQASVVGQIDLGGPSVADTGHDLFHRDTGGGIACASCHLEGAEDGHTWHFSELGARRTQPLNVGLRGSEPFHWDGAMQGLGAIMTEVFVGRMGGAPQSPERLDALADWVLDLQPPAPVRDRDDPAAKRGKVLFESDAVGCAVCHSGPKLTNNTSVDVGTSKGVPLQVPSLLGVGMRAPLMHDGCAKTLEDRFNPKCGGGDSHGTTSQLTPEQIADLVAYLETL